MTDYKLEKDFIQDLNIQGYSKNTIRNTISSIRKYLAYLETEGLRIEEVKVKDAQRFQGSLLCERKADGRLYEKSSIKGHITGCIRFYDYLKRKGLVYSNPFCEITRVKTEKKLPAGILREEDMNRFLETLMAFDMQQDYLQQRLSYRVHVIAELMYSTGLRISEVAGLREEDMDFIRGIVYVEHGKGGLKREVFLNDYAKEVLKIYVYEMRYLLTDKKARDKALIFGSNATTLCRAVNKELRRVSRELGIKVQKSHSFRHALGYHLLRAGCGIRYIQAILGHRLIKNTEIYTRVDKDDLKKVLDEYHPRSIHK